MGKQVVTIKPGGGMEGLQRKRGQGLDLRQFGRARISRVSEIAWEEPDQKWAVRILQGRYAGRCLTYSMWKGVDMESNFPHGCTLKTGSGLMLWPEYDDAVKAEVEFLDALRLKEGGI